MKLPKHRTRSRTELSDQDRTGETTAAQLPEKTTNPASLMPNPALMGAQFGQSASKKTSSGGFLSKLGRLRGPISAAVLGAMLATASPSLAQQTSLRPVPRPTAIMATEIGALPQLGAPIFEVASGYAEQVQAEAMSRLRPEALFDQMEAGRLRVKVPLQAGDFDVGGTKITVHPGTVVYATVQIEDGRLVPYDDGEGTRVQLTKVIDGPVWTTAHGVYLKGKKDGEGQAMVDVAGWFDKALGAPGDLQVGGIISRLAGSVGEAAGDMEMPAGLVDWDGLEFGLDPVRMGNGVVDLGGIQLDLAEGTQLHLSGDLDTAVLTAHFALDDATVRQPGLLIDMGEASADLRLVSTRHPNGNFSIRGGFENLSGTVDRFVADHDRNGRAASLNLTDVTLKDASLDLSAGVTGVRAGDLKLANGDYRFQGDIRGRVADSKVTLPDGRGSADLTFSADLIAGKIDAGTDRVAITTKLTDATFGVSDLQPKDAQGTFDVQRGAFRGDVELSFDTKAGTYQAFVDASHLDVVLDDVKSDDGVNLDLGRTELSGSGKLWMGPGSLRVEGDIAVSGRIDDLKVDAAKEDGAAKAVFDVAAGSTMQGRLRTLAIAPGAPIELNARAAVNLDLEDYAVTLPGFSAEGPTTIAGQAHLQVKNDRVRLGEADLIATMTLEDGAIAAGDGTLGLDLANGSSLRLAIRDAAFGGPDGARPMLSLGAGSHLEASLDGGHLDVAQRRVSFEPGTLVRFEMASLEHHPERGSELVGSLYLDAPVHLAPLVPAEQLTGLLGDGGVGVRIDGVRLGQGGQLTMEGVGLSFEGTVGSVEHVKPARERARLATLFAAHPELKSQQDLINYFYRVGGDWLGASRAAEAYGLDLGALTEAREAPAQAQLAEQGETAAQLLAKPHHVPSQQEVSEAHAGQMLGIEAPAEQMTFTQLAERIDDGRLIFSVPLQGEIKGVAFEEGTVLYVTARAEDGKIVPGEFDAFLNKPGDATAWTTLEGAYLDDENNLMLSVGWWFDRGLEGFENLPMELPKLVERLQGMGGGDGANGLDGVADFSKAQIVLKDLTFEEGRMPFAAGFIEVDENTKFTIAGTPSEMHMRGHLDASAFVVDTESFALDAKDASADVHIVQRATEDGGRTATITFSNLDLDGRGLVYRSKEGDLAHLGAGQARGQVVLEVERDAEGHTSIGTHFALEAFDGDVEAVRFRLGADADPTWVTVGPSKYNGSFTMADDGAVAMEGHAATLDMRVTNGAVTTPAGKVALDDTRLFGSGLLLVDGERMAFKGGPLAGAAEVSADALGIDDVFPGYLENIDVDGAKATFRFDLEHVDRVEHDKDVPLIIEGAKGELGGNVDLDQLGARVSAKPFDSGVNPPGDAQ